MKQELEMNFDLTGNFQSTLYLVLYVMGIVQGLLIFLESSVLVTLFFKVYQQLEHHINY